MQTRQQVFCEIKDHIMLIRVDNPETKNGLDWDGIEQLARSYEELQANPDVRVGIITGNEQYFYTGGRVDPNAPGEKDKYTDALTHFLKTSGAVTKPMIAAVNGDCMKAGMGVLALCDFAVARKGVVFNFPEVRMGGVPMMVLVDIVDAMPRKRALEALLTSWDLSAEEALQIGLVNRVVAKEEFWPTVYRFADAMLATQPWLIDMTKQAYEDMVHLKTREERIAYADKMLRGDVLLLAADTEFVLGMVKKPAIEQLVREKAAAVLGRAVQVRFVLKTQLGSSGADPLDRLVAFGKEHSDIFTIK